MFTTLISPTELAQQLDDPACMVFDCRFKLDDLEAGRRAYYAAHVPGAIYAHLDYDLSGWQTGTNGRHPLPSERMMIATFSAWGIDSKKQVVAYDDANGGLGAARLWWMLRYLGHDQVAVLDGGWQAWIGENRPTEEGLNMPTLEQFVGQARPAMQREADSLFADGTLLIDSRAVSRYRGDEEPIDKVAGHIPGAKNFHWHGIVGPNGRLLPPDQLRLKLQAVIGDTPPDHCVFYCGSGVSAAANVLAMEVAGLSGAKLYSGSWSEWSSDPSRPVATGMESR